MKIYVVGIGPGDSEQMTRRAANVLDSCEVLVGYHVYVDLIKSEYPDKEYLTTPMKKESERCRAALDLAVEGKNVAMICSGDAGVYGMAGLMLEMSQEFEDIEVEVIPGVTAANSGGAVLGAPLGHDFVVISLSDLLTPWRLIEERLEYAAMGDFAICLYNPASIKRADYLQKACDVLLRHKSGDTVCGIVRNIGRDGESMKLLSLGKLRDTAVDMFTTVYVGNAQTKEIGGRMVTPRGYKNV